MTTRLILVGLALAQLADAATFVIGEALHGIGLESNGVAVAIYGAAGANGVLVVKGAVLLATIMTLAVSAPRYPRLLVWGGAAATSIGLLGFLANLTSILLLAG
jgi:hypothetical protein